MSKQSQSVDIAEIKRHFEALMMHLDSQGIDFIEFDQDYFWSINAEELYDVYRTPQNLTIGQISESLSHLRRVRSGERPRLGYDLVWLADILRAIGHKSLG